MTMTELFKDDASTTKPVAIEATLAAAETVLTDSEGALNWAYANGLASTTRVKTSSPWLLLPKRAHIEALEASLNGDRRQQYQRAIGPFSLALYSALNTVPELSDYALTAARETVTMQTLVRKAACLVPEDFDRNVVHLASATGDAQLNARLNPPWASFFGDAGNLTVLEVKQDIQKKSGALPPTRRERWKLQGWEYVGFRLLKELWARLPASLTGHRALIARENELLRETAFFLGSRGWGVVELPFPSVAEQMAPDHILDALNVAARPVIESFGAQWFTPEIQATCTDLFLARLATAVGRQIAARGPWLEVLDGIEASSKDVVLSNFPGSPDFAALAQICTERKITLASFQHGATEDICGLIDEVVAYRENNISDIHFGFGRDSELQSGKSVMSKAQIVAVGLPRQYYRSGHRKRDGLEPLASVVYVSTKLYKGNTNAMAGSRTDAEMALDELRIVNEVLAQLPHSVLFKPYPEEIRYTEGDPTIEAARGHAGIAVMEKDIDLRFILRRCRILVASRATSTIGWCLTSGKPFVFINFPNDMPISTEARDVFGAGVFVFDADDADFHSNLRNFLSQPFADIEAAWRDKAAARASMVEQYFSVAPPNAGARAAQVLVEAVGRSGSS